MKPQIRSLIFLWLFEWMFMSIIFLFVVGVPGVLLALIASIVLTIVTVIIFHDSWERIENQLPKWMS